MVSRHGRQNGDAPELGKVARLREVEALSKKSGSRKRGGRESAARKRSVFIRSVWLTLGTLGMIALAIYLWVYPYLFPDIEDQTANIVVPEEIVRVESKFPSPSKEEAVELVKRALTHTDLDRVESFFRLGTATRSEVVDFLKAMKARDGTIDRYDWLSSMDSDGMLIEGVLVVFKGKEKPVERLAFLTPDDVGTWKLDFEAFARKVSPSWNDLLEKGADHATVRVFLGPDSYYNGPFGDESAWTCYGMASPDTDVLLRGYCKVGSPQAEVLSKLFSDGRRMSRATLEIRRVKEGGALQFEITRVLAEDWVMKAPAAK